MDDSRYFSLILPELWDIQKKAIDYIDRGNERYVVLPTGMGKTIVALETIRKMKVPTIIACPTIELSKQWAEEIRKAGGKCTVVSSETGKEFSPLTVITDASLLINLDMLPKFNLIIYDEVHHIFSPEYSKILLASVKLYNRKILGMTASKRQRGEESVLQDKIFPEKFEWTLAERQRSKYAVDLNFIEEKLRLPDTDFLRYSELWDTYSGAVRHFGGFAEMMSMPYGNDMGGKSSYVQLKKLLSEHPKKIDRVVEIIKNSPGNFVVFGDTISTIEKIHIKLQRDGIRSAKIHAVRKNNKNDRIEQSKASRENMISEIRSGNIRVLLGVTAIEEGLNFPAMDNAIFISCFSSSQIKIIQRAGRTMRGKEGKSVSIHVLYFDSTKEEENLPFVRRNVGAEK